MSRNTVPRLALFSAAMLIGLVIFYSEIVLLVIATVYVSSGPVMKLVHLVRRFLPGTSQSWRTRAW